MQQPELPSLPPMQTVSPYASSSLPERPPQPASRSVPMSKRLRQMVAVAAGGGIGLVAMLAIGQLTLKPGLRPTDLAATFEAQTELGIFNQKLGAKAGEVLITEDQYRERLAEAERTGQARAELVFQRELSAIQADKERIVGAYQALYQRANLIAQAGLQVEQQAILFRQRLIEQTNGGRVVVLNIYDAMCGFGSQDACEKARNIREGMVTESTQMSEGDLARKINELMAGIPDPATLVADGDLQKRGQPELKK